MPIRGKLGWLGADTSQVPNVPRNAVPNHGMLNTGVESLHQWARKVFALDSTDQRRTVPRWQESREHLPSWLESFFAQNAGAQTLPPVG